MTEQNYTILVVDDNEAHRRLERDILELSNNIVIEAKNGQEALELLKQVNFDVVLMDKNMPVLDGDETSYKIRNDLNLKLLPILMVTGSDKRAELVKSLKAGANDFISKPYSPTELTARVNAAASLKRKTDQLDNMENMLYSLALMVEAKDGNTGDHCKRLSYSAEVFGEKIGLNSEELEALKRGGVLHDIGKLGIPDNILLKPGKLNAAEWEVMKTHTTIGYHICNSLRSIQSTTPIILSHHERWDGSGYPQKLKGNDIPLLAQVFQLLDIYDALAYARPYKPAFQIQHIINVINEEVSMGWRNPELANEFIELIEKDHNQLTPPEDYIVREPQEAFMELTEI